MTGEADFTSEEWDLLLVAPSTAGMIVITAERGGQFRESISMAKAYAEARKEHGDSQLLDELVSAKPKVDSERFRSAQERKQHGLQLLHEAAELLDRKATRQETDEYKAFVNGLAKGAADASKAGFLGLRGKRVSDAERSAIEDIAYALDSGGRWSAFERSEPESPE